MYTQTSCLGTYFDPVLPLPSLRPSITDNQTKQYKLELFDSSKEEYVLALCQLLRFQYLIAFHQMHHFKNASDNLGKELWAEFVMSWYSDMDQAIKSLLGQILKLCQQSVDTCKE